MFEMIKKELPSVNLLSSESEIKGDIVINGDFRFDGKLIGNITCSGKLTIGSTAQIEGEISSTNIEISGKINGKITTKELTIFKDTAFFNGFLSTTKMLVEVGSVLIMNCNMTKNSYGTEVANDNYDDSIKIEEIV